MYKGAEIEDLVHCAELLVKSMIIREKYMVLSQQTFPFTTAKYLNKVFFDDKTRRNSVFTNDVQQEFFDKQDDGLYCCCYLFSFNLKKNRFGHFHRMVSIKLTTRQSNHFESLFLDFLPRDLQNYFGSKIKPKDFQSTFY
jgi:hypothetical protein